MTFKNTLVTFVSAGLFATSAMGQDNPQAQTIDPLKGNQQYSYVRPEALASRRHNRPNTTAFYVCQRQDSTCVFATDLTNNVQDLIRDAKFGAEEKDMNIVKKKIVETVSVSKAFDNNLSDNDKARHYAQNHPKCKKS
jgi:hypothetical protein